MPLLLYAACECVTKIQKDKFDYYLINTGWAFEQLDFALYHTDHVVYWPICKKDIIFNKAVGE